MKQIIAEQYKDWDYWRSETTHSWGAILSRKRERPIILDGYRTKEELIEAIEDIKLPPQN